MFGRSFEQALKGFSIVNSRTWLRYVSTDSRNGLDEVFESRAAPLCCPFCFAPTTKQLLREHCEKW